MREFFFSALSLSILLGSGAWGQLEVRLETPKAAYLQYAPIPFTVCLRNMGGQEVVLENSGGKPWLELLVQSRDGLVVPVERKLSTPEKKLKPGERVAIPVDLSSHFLVRNPGGYQARATIREGFEQNLMTDPLDFLVGRGEVIWNQSRGTGADKREYSLLKFYEDPDIGLYLRIEEPERNIVYPCRRLGPYLPLSSPKAEFDAMNHLHLLHQTSVGVYHLVVTTEEGRTLREETRQEGIDRPRLMKNEKGEVVVEGGEVILPSNLREKLSTLQSRINSAISPAEKN